MLGANRIAGNALMLWGRNLVAMGLGIFSSRWVLMALGAEGLGLYGALMGLLAFAGLVGGVLQLSMTRSMSVRVGAEDEPGLAMVERASLLLSLSFAILLAIVALPAGELYVSRCMAMAPRFRGLAVWTWRVAVLGTALSALSMPHASLLTARQRFGVLCGIGLAQSAGYLVLAATMAFALSAVERERLILVFALGNTALVVAASVATVVVARRFAANVACEVRQGFKDALGAMHGLVRFAACEFWSGLGEVVRKNGIALFLNNAFGGAATAAWGIGHTVNNHASSLASSIENAFMPAAMKGGCDGARLSMESARWGFLTTAVFAVPFCFAGEWVLGLWLGNPPEGAAFFASALLVATMIQRLGNAQHLIVMEQGRVALYHAVVGTTAMLTLPLAAVLCGIYGLYGAGWAFVVGIGAVTVERVVLGRVVAGVGIVQWVRCVMLPCAGATALLVALCGVIRAMVPCVAG